MPRFSANLSFLFAELAFLDRFAAAAAAGFAGVEYMQPYAYAPHELAERLRAQGLQQVLFNLPMGRLEDGELGIACLPDRRAEFRAGVEQAIHYALALACPQVNCIAGIVPAGLPQTEALAVLRENLRYATQAFAKAGLRLLLEPINRRDVPGFAVATSAEAMELIEAVAADNLFLQYDLDHMQRMQGELAATLARLLPRIGHIQFADNPGRHEPGSGEINFAFIFDEIDRLGYTGWVGAEYRPRGRTLDSLGWLPR